MTAPHRKLRVFRAIFAIGLGFSMFGFAFTAPVAAQTPGPGSSTVEQPTTGTTSDLKPSLQVDIPTVRFSDISWREEGNFRIIDINWIAEYISGVYKYAVGAAAVLAAALLMMGGVQYLTAGGDASRVSAAKERITNALVGLLLTVGAYLVFNTINPALTNFESLEIKLVKKELFTLEEREDHGDNSDPSGGASPSAVCRSIESCREMCEGTPPTSAPGIMDPSLARPIPTIPGLNGNGMSASQQVIDGLRRAAAIANAEGLTIKVTSGYRPLATQIALVCRRMGNEAAERGIGIEVAWPGGSNHGAGYAVDIQLWRGSTKLVSSGGCSRQGTTSHATLENSQTFDRIMTQAGAKRYSKEVWHYEFGGGSGCRCQYPNCPTPLATCRAMPCT